ncbi:MAG: aminotransferase class V-fold PLP-dependent enzyme [Epsilonproteobacteria bacterium]|nr:aminotransferase class V-fold PLP-dependent enzyme [Campylobacterota bacterium]
MEIYLDNNNLTKLDPNVVGVMEPILNSQIATLYNRHYKSKEMIEIYKKALDSFYAFLEVSNKNNILFTSSREEAISQVFMGIYFRDILSGKRDNIIISQRATATEIELSEFLAKNGVKVFKLPITEEGRIDPNSLLDYITPRTALISIPYVDDASGIIMPVEEIKEIAKRYEVPILVDGSWAVGKIPLEFFAIDPDYFIISSHLIHGPSNIAALYIKENQEIPPLIWDSKIKNGSLRGEFRDIAAISGFAKAVELSEDYLNFEIDDLRELRDYLLDGLKEIDGAHSLSPWAFSVPNTIYMAFEDVPAALLVEYLSYKKIAIYSDILYPLGNFKRVNLVDAMNLDRKLRYSVVGFALSRFNTKEEIDIVIKETKESVKYIRDNIVKRSFNG